VLSAIVKYITHETFLKRGIKMDFGWAVIIAIGLVFLVVFGMKRSAQQDKIDKKISCLKSQIHELSYIILFLADENKDKLNKDIADIANDIKIGYTEGQYENGNEMIEERLIKICNRISNSGEF
jgi:hypothetical protein